MHIFGKVFAVLVVIAAIAAALLTSKLVQVRNSWTAKTVASKNKFAELQPKLEKLEADVDRLKNELFRSRELWGSFWNGVQTNVVNKNDGTLQVNIGTDNGVREKLLLHGFELSADGAATYRGSFTVAGLQNAAANLKPNWRATPDDVGKWQSGNWRWRNAVPSGYQDNFERQLLTILKHEETLKARLSTLAGQKVLLSKADSNLKQREAELVGGADLGKAANVEPEFRDGLVAAVEQTEEDRNQVLRKVDELRRQVRNVQADIEQLQAENIELLRQLPDTGHAAEVTQKK